MGAYQTVAVGTDGSESSYRAVDRAATIAADSKATLLIICAYKPAKSTGEAEQALGEDAAFHVVGSTPAEETLRDARERAATRGSLEIETVAVQGDPIERVIETVADAQGGPRGGRQPRPQQPRGPPARLRPPGHLPPRGQRRPHRPHHVTEGPDPTSADPQRWARAQERIEDLAPGRAPDHDPRGGPRAHRADPGAHGPAVERARLPRHR